MYSHNWRDGEECITPSLPVKLFHASGSSRSCYSTFSVWISNGQWLCHTKGGFLTGHLTLASTSTLPKRQELSWVGPSPIAGNGGDSSTSWRSYRNVLCAGLHSEGSACEGKASPTPRPSAVIPSHGTENKKWQQTGEGPVTFKAGCTVPCVSEQ